MADELQPQHKESDEGTSTLVPAEPSNQEGNVLDRSPAELASGASGESPPANSLILNISVSALIDRSEEPPFADVPATSRVRGMVVEDSGPVHPDLVRLNHGAGSTVSVLAHRSDGISLSEADQAFLDGLVFWIEKKTSLPAKFGDCDGTSKDTLLYCTLHCSSGVWLGLRGRSDFHQACSFGHHVPLVLRGKHLYLIDFFNFFDHTRAGCRTSVLIAPANSEGLSWLFFQMGSDMKASQVMAVSPPVEASRAFPELETLTSDPDQCRRFLESVEEVPSPGGDCLLVGIEQALSSKARQLVGAAQRESFPSVLEECLNECRISGGALADELRLIRIAIETYMQTSCVLPDTLLAQLKQYFARAKTEQQTLPATVDLVRRWDRVVPEPKNDELCNGPFRVLFYRVRSGISNLNRDLRPSGSVEQLSQAIDDALLAEASMALSPFGRLRLAELILAAREMCVAYQRIAVYSVYNA